MEVGRSGSVTWIGQGGASREAGKTSLLERRHLSREAQGQGVGGKHAEEQSLKACRMPEHVGLMGDWRVG